MCGSLLAYAVAAEVKTVIVILSAKSVSSNVMSRGKNAANISTPSTYFLQDTPVWKTTPLVVIRANFNRTNFRTLPIRGSGKIWFTCLAGEGIIDKNVRPIDIRPECPDRSGGEKVPVVLGLEKLSQGLPVPLDANLYRQVEEFFTSK